MNSIKTDSIIRVIHNRENPFVQINKEALWDSNLSLAATGLWTRCLSRPDDWVFNVKELADKCKEGRFALDGCLKELIQHGYCARFEGFKQDASGKLAGKICHYVFFEFKATPDEIEAEHEKFKKFLRHCSYRNLGHRNLGNSHLLKKEVTDIEKTNPLPPKGAAVASSQKKKEPVHECLKKIDLPEEEKIKLTSAFPNPDDLSHAITFALNPQTKIKTSLMQTLWWAARAKPALPIDPLKRFEDNRNYARSLEQKTKFPKDMNFYALSQYAEVSYPGYPNVDIIDYKDLKFKENLGRIFQKSGVNV